MSSHTGDGEEELNCITIPSKNLFSLPAAPTLQDD